MPEAKAKKVVKTTIKTKKLYQDIIAKIEKMSVLELTDFIGALEEKFGAVQMYSQPSGAASMDAGAGAEVSEKSEFDVELIDAGANKLTMIKTIKEITQKGLIEAKGITESVPVVVKEKVKKEEAGEIKKKIEQAGGKAELK